MKNILFTFMLFFFAFSLNAQRHNPALVKPITYNKNIDAPLTAKEKSFIDEVYGDEAETYIYEKQFHLRGIKNTLRNRVLIMKIKDESEDKGYTKLSKVPLFNSFVSTLKRDEVFNPETFNPLKYQFSFHSRRSYTYRVDNSDYLIIIKSQHY